MGEPLQECPPCGKSHSYGSHTFCAATGKSCIAACAFRPCRQLQENKKMSNVLKVEIEREFDDSFMQALFVSVCESAIEYWADPVDQEGTDDYREFYDEAKTIIISIDIRESEVLQGKDHKQLHKINGRTFMLGIERIMQGDVAVRPDLFNNVCQAVLDSDDSHLDSETVDVIVQAGLYNQLMWG